jgi:hypothetical protein
MIKNYKNDFGELNENSITLIVNERVQTINLKNIVKIKFVKEQKCHYNYLAFLVSTYLMIFLKNNNLSQFYQLIIISITSILLITSFFLKTFQYRFVLIKNNYLIEIKVGEKMISDAKNLACQINKKISNRCVLVKNNSINFIM